MKKCGLLGEKLGHSYSPLIHSMLGDYEYRLYEKSRGELADFIQYGDWDALNVTIPYKKAVLPCCAALSETARRAGSVNTLVRGADGSVTGYNTDAFGFEMLLRHARIDPAGKKALVLGSGGASAAVCVVLRSMGAGSVSVISRSGEDNYGGLGRHADAELIVNATPVGMYPGNGARLISLSDFPECRAAVDLIYNPARSAFLMEAESLGIRAENGLYMLAAQAKRSAELFTGNIIDDTEIGRVVSRLRSKMLNVALIGMPGCGKSTLAALLADRLGREAVDSDAEIERRAGMTVPEIFARRGEEAFRRLESEVLSELGRESGRIISTGGGCVTREENYPSLHQNGVIVLLRRDTVKLPRDGRPLSLSVGPEELYARRAPLYERFADFAVSNDGAPEDAAAEITGRLGGM